MNTEGRRIVDQTFVGKVWRTYTYDLTVSKDIARFVARQRHAWPGGYEMAAVCNDGELLCNDCCWKEYKYIAHAGNDRNNSWLVAGLVNASEIEPDVDNPLSHSCSHCGRNIEFTND